MENVVFEEANANFADLKNMYIAKTSRRQHLATLGNKANKADLFFSLRKLT